MITKNQAIEEGEARLYPGLTNPHWLVLKRRREIFSEWIAQLPERGLLVLDIGGRIQPYRSLLKERLLGYVAVDLRATPLVSALAQAQQLPFRDGQFDLVICTQVLQYIPEPGAAIREAARVLKPGGRFFLSVPAAYPSDSELECWRFLPEGIRHLLEPFSRVEIVPEGRSVAGFFRTTNACLSIFARYAVLRSVLKFTAYPALNLLGAALETLAGSANEQFAVNYSVKGEK